MHTLILGFDSFDPRTFEKLAGEGKLPNLGRYAAAGQYARFTVSDPPQTEVSWTSIATGQDPGGHGIFDFVHRDPASYTPFVSLLPTQKGALGVQFVPPFRARTLFEEATRMGYPATAMWWPGLFPARPELPVQTIPGLGTPDIQGKLGVGLLYTTETAQPAADGKTAIKPLDKTGAGRYTGSIEGPLAKQPAKADLQLDLLDERAARLTIGKQSIPLTPGAWSPYIEIEFKLGLFVSVKVVTRAILTQTNPEVRLYFLPLQIHPLASPWRYGTPPGFIKRAWKESGPFLTLGWPQDTSGLEEGCINDEQFLALCDSIFESRERALMHQLDSFNEGVLAIIFDSLDRVQHMFRRDRQDVIESWYVKLDGLVGRVAQRLSAMPDRRAQLLVLSDHGFTEFTYKVHLNRWLAEHGWLTAQSPNGKGGLDDVDWSRSQAYAVGLNSLYLNLAGREGQGSVPAEQAPGLVDPIRQALLDWRGPDGRPVVQRALRREEAFSGPLSAYGPDILLGYSPGYRASSETGLGRWAETTIEANHDHWGADHCIDSQAVPGVIFGSQGLHGLSAPSFRHIPALATGKELEQGSTAPPPPGALSGEDKKVLEERLKGLGYL
ncbi:MAG: alkaline phosphatase family protein [Chloroflexota bacterium]